MNLLFEGIKYQLQAQKRHGIHSPFVYDLSTNALGGQLPLSSKMCLSQFDQAQRSNPQIIEFKDFGAGSKNLNAARKISEIHRISSSHKIGHLLYRLVHHYQPNSILELGTSLGRGTLAMHLAHPEAKITTVEGCKAVAEIARDNFQQYAPNPKQITLINEPFSDFINALPSATFDLIYVDGHHDGIALEKYCAALENYLHENSLLLLDDIRWSESMFNAWKTLYASEKFHLSIDFFRIGMLMKRTSQHKEHFILKT